jgi:hypothetical protein
MIHDSASVGLGDAGPNLFELPLLRFQIRLHGFAEKIAAVAVKRVGQRIQRGYFFGFQAEANGLFFHNTIQYAVSLHNTTYYRE